MAMAPPTQVILTPSEFFFAPSAGIVSTRMTSSRWNADTGVRKLLHANQEFQIDSACKITAMRAAWTLDELDATPLKVIIVTGGASGLGAAVARRFAADDYQVVIADVADDQGTALAAEIHGCYVRTDVSQDEDVEALVALTVVIPRATLYFACGFQGCSWLGARGGSPVTSMHF